MKKMNDTQKKVNALFWHLWNVDLELSSLIFEIEAGIANPKNLRGAKLWSKKSDKLLNSIEIVGFLKELE